MSQVIITEDQLKDRRQQSAAQEHKINRDGVVARFRKSDVTGFDPIKKAIGLAALPIVAIWSAILFAIGLAIGISGVIFRGIGKIWRQSPN